MSDNPPSLRYTIQERESLANKLPSDTVDNSYQKNTGELPTIKLEMINMDPLELEDENKTDEPLFVRVGNTMYTTYAKNAKIKMLAYKAIQDKKRIAMVG